jgi:hypothetical protein
MELTSFISGPAEHQAGQATGNRPARNTVAARDAARGFTIIRERGNRFMSVSIYFRTFASAAVAASLAVTGCAKDQHDRHDHAAGVKHVHLDDGKVACADAPASPALAKTAAEMAAAANAFLAALDEEQLKQAAFEFGSAERVNWHFIPRERKGLPLKAMKPEQQELAKSLLKSGLSARGFAAAEAIRGLEGVLREMEKDPVKRDPEKYFFSVFGKPEAAGTWGWRFEGHHQSFNFTLVEGKSIVATPNFMGTNPGEVRQGDKKGLRVLGEEEDRGRKLVSGLSAEQKKRAIFSADAPKDIVSGTNRQAQIEGNLGIGYGELKDPQREELLGLIDWYAHRLRDELANQDLEAIRAAGLDNVKFAWAGSLERGKGHYYRVQGPTFLIEYDNTQNDANHAHTVWRSLQGKDFGDDLLKEHYEGAKGDKAHGHDAK